MANENKNVPKESQPMKKKFFMNRNVMHNGLDLKKDSVCPEGLVETMTKFGYASEKKVPAPSIGVGPNNIGIPGKVSADDKPEEDEKEEVKA